MINFLNAADFGLLFRDNVIMNNVASPSKFAEYMLCGLPTIISEGVGDYTEFCISKSVGIVVKEDQMNNWNLFDYSIIEKANFVREKISENGLKFLSKQSIVNLIISEFNKKF
jgi:hypothetical protein